MEQKIRQDISIGANLRDLRKKTGLTQEQTVARMQLMGCQITRSSYAKIETGRLNIRVTELMSLKGIFKAEYDEIFKNCENLL